MLFKGTIHSRGSYTDLANSGIDLVSLLRPRDSSKNDDDDDTDSAIDEDSEPAQTPHLPGVILRKGKWGKGIKAVNRWSTTSSIDIEADFEAMANKVLSHNTLARLLMAVDKTRNTEHSGTFRNIPEHEKIKIIFMKKNNKTIIIK